ncbi:hypothetical protein AYO49_03010 [Verrucomicrobiaceae bacterium SCGC AG-212-N21]|nr:hypothetical protein AYO49_03010 [Verrucomicrobiaceae bacterium SCGC AG-212-N21]
MKFCQLLNHTPTQLAAFYAERPSLQELPFKHLTRELAADMPHATADWTETLVAAGHEVRLIVANDAISQQLWLSEKVEGSSIEKPVGDATQLVAEQLRKIKPDVLCVFEPASFDRRFMAHLKRKPDKVIGWTHALAPAGTDLRDYDLILSPYEACVRQAWRLGAKDARLLAPGFPRSTAEAVCAEPLTHDVVYCGTWRGSSGAATDELVTALVDSALSAERPFVLSLHLEVPAGVSLPPAVAKLHQPPVSGMARYRAISRARVHVVEPTDPALGPVLPLAALEGVGLGVCTLAPAASALAGVFDAGKEIATYASPADLKKQILELLREDGLRRRLARDGQERCLTQRRIEPRANELVKLLEEKPQPLKAALRRAWHRVRR